MGKGFFISRSVGWGALLLGAVAVATIVALAVVYAQEKSKSASALGGGTMGVATVPTSTATPTSTPSNEPWDRYRLPDTLKPRYYNLTLWPRLQVDQHGLFVFTGSSSVVFTCVKETDLFLIHSNKLNLTAIDGHLARLTALDRTTAPAIKATWLQVETQFLVIQLDDTLSVGWSYQLDTEFRGELTDDLGGFYRSEFDEDGEKKVVATTQMQPTDARKVFPCFDEPAMKAVFHITLIHEPGTVALSNGMEMGSSTAPPILQ